MIRVGEGQKSIGLSRLQSSEGNRKQKGSLSSAFSDTLNNVESQESAERVEDLRLRVEEQGRIISEKMNLKELEKYRELIGELFNEVASNAFSNSRSDQFDFYGHHKTYVLIKKINRRLDDLARELLEEQSDNMKLIQMVDDIKGLLIDIFL